MFPHERSLVEQLNGKPFALIGVNSDKDMSIPQKLAAEGTVTWRSFWNGEDGTGGPISTDWGVTGWPTIYIIDGQGVIRYKYDYSGAEKIDRMIEQVLGEMGHEVKITHPAENSGGSN